MSINKVIILGNLTRDAECRQAGQKQAASFTVATSERYKDRNGQAVESTEFHDCELYGAEGVHPYLTKGRQVYIEGQIKTDSWTDRDGVERKMKKIRVREIQLVGGEPRQQGQPSQPQSLINPAPAGGIQRNPYRAAAPAQGAMTNPAYGHAPCPTAAAPVAAAPDSGSDDLPF